MMEFQLSYFRSWKMMLWKCFTQYASKFGKLSSGHRTGKGQFSFQSQRKWNEVAQLCPTLCNPMDCSLPGSSLHGIFQARVLEWVAISFSRGSSWPRDRTQVSRIPGRCFNLWATREAQIWLQSRSNSKSISNFFSELKIWDDQYYYVINNLDLKCRILSTKTMKWSWSFLKRWKNGRKLEN